jgi:intracellular sulfur oxidation DsrE/DsrF family protein
MDVHTHRRGFLRRLFGAAAAASVPFSAARADAAQASGADDWINEVKGAHRALFDFPQHKNGVPLLHILNYLNTYSTAYKTAAGEVGAVGTFYGIGTQASIPLGFNDAMWTKYGKIFSRRMEWVDPATKEAPTTNIHARRLTALFTQGLQLAVCNRTTRALVNLIAQQTDVKPEDVRKELTSNTLGPSHFVPAGVVAVTRAQERGYANISIG